MARPSIAWRLAAGLSATMAVLWIGAAGLAGTVMYAQINEAFDQSLRQGALRLLPLAVHEIGEGDKYGLDRVRGSDRDEDEAYFTYYLIDQHGAMVLRTDDAPDISPPVLVSAGFSDVDGKRLFSKTDPRSGFSIVLVERTEHRRAALRAALATILWPLAGLIPLVGGGIWIAIRLGMRPVERLTHDISQRGSRNLSPLTSDGQPAELAPIAEAVASLLTRLSAALDAERAFAASSAHELRTPIAGALAQTQQLAIELGDQPAGRRLREVEFSLRRLAQLSEKLLQLSRLDAGFAQAESASDLLPALRLVVRDFQVASRTQSRVRLQVAQGLALVGRINLDAFAIAVRNLIQNALIHGAPDGLVEVVAGPGRQVRVINAGPVVPGATLARIAEPFRRGSTSAKGTGLGLSIVRSIMDQTGGSLTLRSPAIERKDGFEAILQWPDELPSEKVAVHCRSAVVGTVDDDLPVHHLPPQVSAKR
ncbi:sensor histidine kinase [Xanthobacter autotrophicus]|uniref:sensor histidine kinase n=1 Tax=Xanthobacter autotrophicus TaxID=280 RepID=UPI0037265A61